MVGQHGIVGKVAILFLIIGAIVLLHNLSSSRTQTRERFAMLDPSQSATQFAPGTVQAAEPLRNEDYKPVDFGGAEYPRDCFPRDKLTAEDLLPKDAANSLYAQVSPSGQGDVLDQNFLTAGYHIGVNTIGQSLRNPNLQLRSDPYIPRMQLSPWNQSTIDPDINRRPFEIGGDDCPK
jgi:hypothetical protein